MGVQEKENNNKAKILIVDDKEINLIALEQVLEDIDAEILFARGGKEAVSMSNEQDFAIILMDIQMPDMNGYMAATLIREESKNKSTPIVFVSAVYSDDYHKIEGVRSGGIDFITKPIKEEIIIGKIKLYLELYHAKMKIVEKNSELEAALKEIKELKHYISICAVCKKMRDDDGNWHSIEQYMYENTNYMLSHGYCPECAAEAYKEIEEMKLKMGK